MYIFYCNASMSSRNCSAYHTRSLLSFYTLYFRIYVLHEFMTVCLITCKLYRLSGWTNAIYLFKSDYDFAIIRQWRSYTYHDFIRDALLPIYFYHFHGTRLTYLDHMLSTCERMLRVDEQHVFVWTPRLLSSNPSSTGVGPVS